MFNIYKLDYTTKEINSKLGKVEYKLVDEFSDFEEFCNNSIEEGKYRFSDGDFIYSLTVERPDEITVSQSYWSTEEGIECTYIRTGWVHEDGICEFNDWSYALNSQQAYDAFAQASHSHYTMTSTDDFETWIKTFRAGEQRIIDRSTQKYYYVRQYDYNVALNGYLRRVQIYFEITEPWITYSRAGTAPVGSSSSITWGNWHKSTSSEV